MGITGAALALAILSGCGWIDAVTGATEHKHGTKIPESTNDHEVFTEVDGLNNFAVKYSDKFYRGGTIENEDGIAQLKKWGVGTIISVTPTDEERKLAREAGLRLVELSFAKQEALPREELDKFAAAVRAEKGAVYAHCLGGMHRGGALGLYYCVAIDGWTYEKALAEFIQLGGDLEADAAMIESVKPAGK